VTTSSSLADSKEAEGRCAGKRGRSARAQGNIKGENMKLSVEAKLAAAVAAGFMVLTAGAMAQGRGRAHSGSNHYGPTDNPAANTQMSQQGANSSLSGRTNAEENRPTFSDEKVTSSGREQREDRHDAREQREDRRDAREQRADRHEAREQRQDRQQAQRQRAERYQNKSTKDKSPFDGSILEVKPVDLKR
jgi:hypothetical protein